MLAEGGQGGGVGDAAGGREGVAQMTADEFAPAQVGHQVGRGCFEDGELVQTHVLAFARPLAEFAHQTMAGGATEGVVQGQEEGGQGLPSGDGAGDGVWIEDEGLPVEMGCG